MLLELITPDKKVFEGSVIGVQLPGVEGSFEVLKGHAALISALEKGRMRVRTPEETLYYQIDGGIVEVIHDKVTVLAESVVQ